MNPHGKPPFGFRWSGDVLEPDEREQLAIAAIEDYRDQGWTLRKIAIALNGAGLSPRHGKTWQPSSVASIVKRLKSAQPESAEL